MSDKREHFGPSTTATTEQDQDSAAATTAFSPEESRGIGSRFIAGFAAAGLLLAAAVGVWTLQASNDTVEARQRTLSEQTSISESSTGQSSPSPRSTTSPTKPEQPRTPENSGLGGSQREGAQQLSNVSPLGDDPYLPPNAWGGEHKDYTEAPAETAFAEPPQQSAPETPQGLSTSEDNLNLGDLPQMELGDDNLPDFLAPSKGQDDNEDGPVDTESPSPTVTVTDLPTDTSESSNASESPTTANYDGSTKSTNATESENQPTPTDTTGE